MKLFTLILYTVTLIMSSALARETTSYLQRVVDFADTMLLYGTDRYGEIKSPYLATALTRVTIPELVPASPKLPDWPPRFTQVPNVFNGSDYAHKITIRGGDVGTDVALYQMLYLLSDVTGDSVYTRGADDSLRWFLENTPDPWSGLFTWGEHSGWDFRKDTYLDGDNLWFDSEYWAKHEFQGSVQGLYDQLATLSQHSAEIMTAFARGLWNKHVWFEEDRDWFPGDTGFRYSRHGQIGPAGGSGGRTAGGMYPRHGGYMVNTMSMAYATAADPAVRSEIIGYINSYVTQWERLVDHFGYVPYDVGSSRKSQNSSLASECRYAAKRLTSEHTLVARIFALANKLYVEPKAYDKIGNLMTTDIGNRSLGKNTRHVDRSDYNIGWDLPGRIPSQYASAILKLVNAAQEADFDAPHSAVEYLQRADYFADQAIDLFLEDGTDSPLPRMLDKNSPVQLVDGTPARAFYHSYTGGDDLMYALLKLYIAGEF